jgi:hypothetical protein
VTYIFIHENWHRVATASPGGLIGSRCGAAEPYRTVLIATTIPASQRCLICEPDPESSGDLVTIVEDVSDGTPDHEQLVVTMRGNR